MDYPPLIPYLVVSDAAGAIEFYKLAFGAIELTRHTAGASEQISACAFAGEWRERNAVG